MVVKTRIRKGAYFDSVTLMNVGRELSGMDGVDDAAVVMGTGENKNILRASDLLTPELESAVGGDLLIAVRASDEASATAALAAVDGLLTRDGSAVEDRSEREPRSLEGVVAAVPDANLALISVAGRYAGAVAEDALERGLHVMLFSDNVPLDVEIALKKKARELGLLVMGPDCGTAIVNGAPLGFANAVSRGHVGIVAASGTGLQEVSCLLSNDGLGVSQALGTGGRDVSDAVAGITFLDAMRALGDDPETEVVMLVSKPPDPGVHAAVRDVAAGLVKPVVSVFLGAEPEGVMEARTLAEAAAKAAAVARGEPVDAGPAVGPIDDVLSEVADDLASARGDGRRYMRGLMSGGTFASEAVLLLGSMGVPDLHANVSGKGVTRLDDPLTSVTNTVVDMGADEFTVGRPHPMIDYSLRRKRITAESNDPETAVVLLDVVLGYGANLDPASELEDVVRDASSRVAVVCSITGTERDPQVRSAVEARLRRAGAVVMPSNEAACRLAGKVVLALGER